MLNDSEAEAEEESKGPMEAAVAVKAKTFQKKSPAHSMSMIGVEPIKHFRNDVEEEEKRFKHQKSMHESAIDHNSKVLEKQPLAENEWMHSVLDRVSEKEANENDDDAVAATGKFNDDKNADEDKQPEDSEDDAAIITKFDRKNRNRTKWYDRKSVNADTEGFALEDIIDQAIKKNKAQRRQSRREKSQQREDSQSPSPDREQQPEKKSPSKWKAMRRKQYEEPDLL